LKCDSALHVAHQVEDLLSDIGAEGECVMDVNDRDEMSDQVLGGADGEVSPKVLIEMETMRLGLWLEENIEIIVATSSPAPDSPLADVGVADQLAESRRLLTRAVACYLITEDLLKTQAVALEGFRIYKSLAAQARISCEELMARLLCWRDDVVIALGHAASELDVSNGALERAAKIVRGSADRSVVRMAQHFEADRSASLRLANAQQDELSYSVTHDMVTGLENRAAFQAQLAALTSRLSTHREQVAVLVADLDRFEQLTDTFGPTHGDNILRLLAKRLRGTVRSDELVARLDADTFGFAIHGVDATIGATSLARRIHAALTESFSVAGIRYAFSATIGIAVSPDHGRDVDVLLARASSALHRAQETRRSSAFYDRDHDSNTLGKFTLLHELRQALESDELVLYYQPKVDLITERVVGVEALVRWQHPHLSLLTPDEFLPLAETAGLMGDITKTVMEKALQQSAEWRSSGLDLDMSINLSATDLDNGAIAAHLAATLARTNVPADRVILEITETVAISDRSTAVAVLEAMTDLGVRVSLDDFGTGYSALAQLTTLPLHELKIDRAFIASAVEARGLAVIAAIATLGHALGHTVVVEGVEDPTILPALKAAGCDQVQGYAVSPPLAPREFRAWLTRRGTRSSVRSHQSRRSHLHVQPPV
jgi:diguanylate cyclase (GGDEF)-like protein